MGEAFVARYSPVRMTLMILGAILFVLLGAWLAGWFGDPPTSRRWGPQAIHWAGWSSILVFGLAAIFGLTRLFQRRDLIVVDEHGLTWRNWSDEHIPWSAVARIQERDQMGQTMFCIHLHDPERHPPTTMLGRVSSLNSAIGFAAITITTAGTDRSPDELRAALVRYGP